MRKAICVCAGLLVSILNGCKDVNPGLATGDSPSNIFFPPNKVSYSAQVQPLFNQACALVGCHDDGQNQSPLKLTTYYNVVLEYPGYVVAGKPDQSTLILSIQGSIGNRMPPTTNRLNDNQINGIRTWVAEGAKNN